MQMRRRGVGLLEILVALVLVALLGTALVRALVVQRRMVSSVLERGASSRALDQASAWLGSEMLELGRDDSASDLRSVAAESLSYRAFRSAGLACLVGTNQVVIRHDQQSLWRAPQPGRDSLLLFLAPRTAPVRGTWSAYPITAVASTTCDGVGATRLGTVFTPAPELVLRNVPARTFESMQLRLYRSLGEWWLGARSVSAGEGLQPVTGPLGERGLQLVYLDSAGAPTLDGTAVRSLRLLLASGRGDSARLLVVARNLQ